MTNKKNSNDSWKTQWVKDCINALPNHLTIKRASEILQKLEKFAEEL